MVGSQEGVYSSGLSESTGEHLDSDGVDMKSFETLGLLLNWVWCYDSLALQKFLKSFNLFF